MGHIFCVVIKLIVKICQKYLKICTSAVKKLGLGKSNSMADFPSISSVYTQIYIASAAKCPQFIGRAP